MGLLQGLPRPWAYTYMLVICRDTFLSDHLGIQPRWRQQGLPRPWRCCRPHLYMGLLQGLPRPWEDTPDMPAIGRDTFSSVHLDKPNSVWIQQLDIIKFVDFIWNATWEQGTKTKHIICKRPDTVHTIILTLRKHLPCHVDGLPSGRWYHYESDEDFHGKVHCEG